MLPVELPAEQEEAAQKTDSCERTLGTHPVSQVPTERQISGDEDEQREQQKQALRPECHP